MKFGALPSTAARNERHGSSTRASHTRRPAHTDTNVRKRVAHSQSRSHSVGAVKAAAHAPPRAGGVMTGFRLHRLLRTGVATALSMSVHADRPRQLSFSRPPFPGPPMPPFAVPNTSSPTYRPSPPLRQRLSRSPPPRGRAPRCPARLRHRQHTASGRRNPMKTSLCCPTDLSFPAPPSSYSLTLCCCLLPPAFSLGSASGSASGGLCSVTQA
jgi:hypothetical protein